MTDFIYTPLKQGEIRLLQLQWNQGNHVPGAMKCTISNHPINAQSFTALSYTWGTDEPSHNLLLNDEPIKIRNNLHDFLSHALPGSSSRLSRTVGPIWIDALCISQSDKAEKASQIAQMASIYAAASRIVIWLGTADATSDTAMEFYARTASLWANNQLPDQTIPLTDGDRAAVEGLTRRSYWSRSWVYQEASTPRVYREFWCGSKAISFDVLCVANALAHRHMTALGTLLEPSPWNRRVSLLNELSDRRRATDRSTFLWLLLQTMGLEALDPRDKIFALLHIYADMHGKLISLEYDVTPEELYRSVAVLILETTRELDLLLFCSIGQYKKLRSWVPNFYRFTYTILGYTYREFFSAGGRGAPRFSVDADGEKLSVVGIRVDVVEAVHEAMVDPARWGDYTDRSEFWQPIFSRWTRSLAAFLFPNACDGKYVSGGTVCEAVDWVLAAGISPGFGTPTRGAVAHWPLLELAASPSGPDIQATGLAFQDLLLRMCGQAVFRTEKGYLGFGDFDALAGDVLVVLPESLAMKAAPALACGNSIIKKISVTKPLFDSMVSLATQAGIPPGVLNYLVGGAEAGKALSLHMDIRKISFTGSIEIGKLIQTATAKSNLKNVTRKVASDRLPRRQSGQSSGCALPTRLYVHESFAEEFVIKLKAMVEDRAQSPGGDPTLEAGLLTGGKPVGDKGCDVEPTIFMEPQPDARVLREEIFGPILVVIKFSTENEVVKLANDTEFGLAAYVWTADISRALRLSQKLEAGIIPFLWADGSRVARGRKMAKMLCLNGLS
ncbi:Aldehyde/histidinol dehydrogenase [Dactylonectria macrodidyma]|uniref:Aldehyde/histidinol dehydrogenase n=1 Tax=Dactylonectria macrodidyma TaxID=307937 RepID=A0A9P9FTC4_9HYPO|nr:Aldehyde/histidinol dehydrogenase [Dactylonectria macrodidyma]